MSEQLKPCPFCGEKEEVYANRFVRPPYYRDEGPELWRGVCIMCDGSGPWRNTKEGAIKAWNERPNEK